MTIPEIKDEAGKDIFFSGYSRIENTSVGLWVPGPIIPR